MVRGSRDDFPRLSVKTRKELRASKTRKMSYSGPERRGGRQTFEARETVEAYGDDVAVFDVAAHEALIGSLKTRWCQTRAPRLYKRAESDKYDHIKNKR